MKLEIASPSLQFSFSGMPQSHAVWHRRNFFESVLLNPAGLSRVYRGHSIRSSYSVKNHSGGLGEEPFQSRDCCTVTLSRNPNGKQGSNFPSKFDFLDPAMLGIVPEPPNWPEREAASRAPIEQKAKNFELPVSMRMIKKKQQRVNDSCQELSYSSLRTAFSSMVSIYVELQSHALKIREVLCDEELDVNLSKARREICLSFVWIFQQVFSRTPELMIHVMVLLADFSMNEMLSPVFITNPEVSPDQELSVAEKMIWNSIVDESIEMGGLNKETKTLSFVSPLTVEIESEDFVDYYGTDFMYQVMLSQDPYSTVLLCNYAQFLQLITRDYERAEECFKRAMEVKPQDAEALCQYANFLWMVRKELDGAEDLYQQAIAADGDIGNPYYASQYANFLWKTGGEETCYPLNVSSNDN
ncbi:unnamed protein product [Cuscuta epithymum]|uniref:Tetratricopeptide repeat-like superfamily protein n=1 Tax=Cuscuta epithymum TaxID=186058 RepID=A0AAV0EC40_9ASTE|nr:unnamed protein product [Cuscuta epithymum]